MTTEFLDFGATQITYLLIYLNTAMDRREYSAVSRLHVLLLLQLFQVSGGYLLMHDFASTLS